MRLSAALLALLVARASAHRSYLAELPNADKVPGGPGIGHTRAAGGGARNAFGSDFAASGHKWSRALCTMDSDGDGRTNGQELGDPECVWEPGLVPQFDTGITHPGVHTAADDAHVADSCDGFALANGTANVTVELRFPAYEVPSKGTTYAKYAFNVRDELDALSVGAVRGVRFGVRFEPLVEQSAVVHHMLLYGCDDLPAQFVDAPTQSADMPCTRLRYAWAVGGGPFCLPDRVGIPFDVDSAEDAWHVLEIHYDNPQRRAGLRDSSGVRLTLVDDGDAGGAYARAGFLWIGAALSKLRIPPGQRAHHVEARCAFPQLRAETRVTAFASMLHAHTLGRAVWTEVHRAHGGGHAYAHDAGCSMAYDFDLQEMVPLPAPVSLGPSDTLVANCVYDSSARSDVTRGGDETADEMCLTFLLYYPEVQGEETVCWAAPVEVRGPSAASHACCPLLANGEVACDAEPGARAPPPAWLYAHAAAMTVAWGALAPCGVGAAMQPLRRRLGASRWLGVHRGLQLGTLALTLLGGVLAIARSGGGRPSGAHALLGIAVCALTLAQALGGLCRPAKPGGAPAPEAATGHGECARADAGGEGITPTTARAAPSGGKARARVWWARVHRACGVALLLAALANIALGGVEAWRWYAPPSRLGRLWLWLPFAAALLGVSVALLGVTGLCVRDVRGRRVS